MKALRFTATGTYTPAQSFAVNFTVQVPVGYVNTVAWNSAASDASYNGTPLLPAEPPKVGPHGYRATADADPGDGRHDHRRASRCSFGDSVSVGNTGGASGTLDWSLLGPPAPGAGRNCAGLDWSSAPTSDHGSIAVSGDGTYTTSTSTPAGDGCTATPTS